MGRKLKGKVGGDKEDERLAWGWGGGGVEWVRGWRGGGRV